MLRVVFISLLLVLSESAFADDKVALASQEKIDEAYFLSVFSSNFSIELATNSAVALDDCALAYQMLSTSMFHSTKADMSLDLMWRSGVMKGAALTARMSGLDSSASQVSPFRELVFEKIEAPLDLLKLLAPKTEECNVMYSKAQKKVTAEVTGGTAGDVK